MCLLQPCWMVRCSACHHGSVQGQFSYVSGLCCSPACLLCETLCYFLFMFPHSLILFSVSTLMLNPHTEKLKFLILECSCNSFFFFSLCWESNSGSQGCWESTVPLSQTLTHMILFMNSRPIAVFCDLAQDTPPCPVLFSLDANHSYFGGLAC